MSYADPDIVELLTNKLKPNNDTSKYDALLPVAIADSEDTIKTELIKNNVPIPVVPEHINEDDPLNTLIKAANLYATAFMFNTYYSDGDTISPTSKQFRTDADTKLQNYIEIILEGYDEDKQKQDTPLPNFGGLI